MGGGLRAGERELERSQDERQKPRAEYYGGSEPDEQPLLRVARQSPTHSRRKG